MRAIKILGAVVHTVSSILAGTIVALYAMEVFPGNGVVMIVGLCLSAGLTVSLVQYFIMIDPDYGKNLDMLKHERKVINDLIIETQKVKKIYTDAIEHTHKVQAETRKISEGLQELMNTQKKGPEPENKTE